VTETTTPPAKRTTLSRELGEFLVEFSIGVHRYAMYPPDHPSLAPVVETIVGRLAQLFEERRTLNIGVAQRRLVIEGVATDEKHPVLSDLAQRIHDHQIGAVTLEVGVTATDIAGMLAALAQETERGATPLGLREEMPTWEHARLHRVGYERLELREDGTAITETNWAEALWLGLAQAMLGIEGTLLEEADPASLAQTLRDKKSQAAYERAIAEYLRRIPRELRGTQGAESEKLRRKVGDFIEQLDDDTLTRLVSFADFAERRQFVLDVSQSLAVDSVVKVLKAAADADQQTISHSMTRLLGKLAHHAEQGTGTQRSQADTALRENVESLIEGWTLKDPNPEEYTNVLDAMSRAASIFRTPDTDEESITGARRLVEMAMEVDAFGPIVAKAVADLMEEGGTGAMLAMIRGAPEGSGAARKVRSIVTTPKQLRHILAAGKVDEKALKALLQEMGADAVEPLLDVLAESQDRSVRRRLLDALISLGPAAGEKAVERLSQGPWFVLRNMLALLRRLEKVPAGFDPQPYLAHDDERVRREAFPLALRQGVRERVLAAALADVDERMVRMALTEIQQEVPSAVLPTLVNRVVRSQERPPEVRAAAIRALAQSRSPLAMNTLLEITTAGKTLFGKPRLAAPSQEVLAGLHVLAQAWAEREEVKDVLDQAAHSRDPEVRGAVRLTSSLEGSAGGRP